MFICSLRFLKTEVRSRDKLRFNLWGRGAGGEASFKVVLCSVKRLTPSGCLSLSVTLAASMIQELLIG